MTGNNDADAVYFLNWAARHFDRHKLDNLREHLAAWGGNSSGVGVANIDPQGKVHPDTYWSDYTIGSVKEHAVFAALDRRRSDAGAVAPAPAPAEGALRRLRCTSEVCGGNTRIRALQLTGDPWAEDPACYLSNAEIGVDEADAPVASRHSGESAMIRRIDFS